MELREPRGKPEHKAQEALRSMMATKGWFTVKTHGNAFQSGLPDLYAVHRVYGTRWIEMKTPGGTLTPAQRHMFRQLSIYGDKIWILRGIEDYPLLLKPTDNWKIFLVNPQMAFIKVSS